MLKRRYSLLVGLILIVLAVTPLEASAIAYGDPANTGNQLWGGSLEEDFTVNSPIVVSALGLYESGQTGIAGLLTVAIFNSSDVNETGVLSFTQTCPTADVGGDCFESLTTPVTLAAGNYSLSTAGWGTSGGGSLDGNYLDPSYIAPALNTGGGLLTFTGIAYVPGGGLQYLAPITSDPGGDPNNGFNAGSFEFGPPAAAGPEPGTAIGVTIGLLVCLIPRLRRQAVKR
jgi:hypothetical protein